MRFKKTIILSIISLFITNANANNVGREWIHHPSLDIYSSTHALASQSTNNVQKLMEGERYVYALITSCYYYNNLIGKSQVMGQTPINIARLDKSAQNPEMKPLLPDLPLSGYGVQTAEYDSRSGCIAIAYDNGAIDFLFDDGKLLSNSNFQDGAVPGGRTVNSLSFSKDGKYVTAATNFGVAVFNVDDASLKHVFNFMRRTEVANLVGDKLIVSTDEGFRYFDPDNPPLRLADAPLILSDKDHCAQVLLTSDNAVKGRYGIYPLDDNKFIFIGDNYNYPSVDGESVNLLTLPEDMDNGIGVVDVVVNSYVALSPMAAGADFVHGFREQGLIGNTREGLLFHTDSNVYLIDYRDARITDTQSAADFAKSLVKTLYKDPVAYTDIQSGQEKYKIMSTYDGETYTYFRPRQGFQMRKVISTDASVKKTVWESIGDVAPVNACPAGFAGWLYYNPAYGIVTHNNGYDSDYSYANGMADGLANFKDGKWIQRSLAVNNYSAGYMYAGAQVAVLPNGAAFDPLEPKYVYTRGRLAGLRRENLEDSDDQLLLTNNAYKTNLPFRVPVVERMVGSSYSTLIAFSEPSFDADGMMWTTFDRLVYPDFPEQHAELWYWSAEDRLACKTPADYEAHPMKYIYIPGVNPSMSGVTFACKLPENKNLVVHASDNNVYESFVYDHNGTPDDTSDDRLAVLRDMVDENGDRLTLFMRPKALAEDPYDGSILLGHTHGLISMSKDELFGQDKVHFTRIRPVAPESNALIPDFAVGGIAGIAIDAQQRKWVAMRYGGVYVLSPDRKNILARYTHENSSLPSNELYAVVYNPESNSIFVSSRYGLSELVLSGADNKFGKLPPSVSPLTVTPDYKGYVTLSGLSDSQDYTLLAPDGSEYSLGSPAQGVIEFLPANLLKSFPKGFYRLKEYPQLEFVIN